MQSSDVATRRPSFSFAVSLCLPALAIVASLWFVASQLPWAPGYSTRPPREIVQEILGNDIKPSEVTDLRVAARQYLGNRWARLSFRADAATLDALLGR